MSVPISISSEINAPVDKVWEMYTQPEHIVNWNAASSDWHTVKADNDLRDGGKFSYRMEAKDGSSGFDFSGVYDEVIEKYLIRYHLDDQREVTVSMADGGNGATFVSVLFDSEDENSVEMQREGWQAILDNFKSYVESNLNNSN